MNNNQDCYKNLISKTDITFADVLEYTTAKGRTPQGETWEAIIEKSKELQHLRQEGFTIFDIRYALKHKIYPEKHFCEIDGKEIHADSKLRYKRTCSKECEKTLHEKINLEIFGNICPAKTDKFKRQSEATKLERYENAHYVNPEKQKLTVLNKPKEVKKQEIQKRVNTRNENIAKNPNYWNDIAAKSRATKVKNGHTETWNNREKAINTCITRYGVENPMQLVENIMKAQDTCITRYGVKSYTQTDECKEKTKATNLQKYGVEISSQANECKEKAKATNLQRYGTEYVLQSPEIKEKSANTMYKRYGVKYAQQNDQIRKKGQKKYYYNGLKFDSTPELAMYIYLSDKHINFVFQPNTKFEYSVEEFGIKKTHFYYADFYLPDYNRFIEIKGAYFFNSDGKMFCPYRYSSWTDDFYENKCKVFEEKYQCMLRNDIQIVLDTSICIKSIMKYIYSTYGKKYLFKFKQKHNDVV